MAKSVFQLSWFHPFPLSASHSSDWDGGMKTLFEPAPWPLSIGLSSYIARSRYERLLIANQALRSSGRPEAQQLTGEEGWKEACRKADVDLTTSVPNGQHTRRWLWKQWNAANM